MSSTKKIALNVIGGGLSLAGVLILLFGYFEVMAGLAWSDGSFRDLFLLFQFVLYAIPAGLGSLKLGIFLLKNKDRDVYMQSPVRAQRQLGLCLLLPAIAA